MRPIITLSSDMGRKDPYLAQIKGTILSYMDDCNILDISHEIKTHDIIDAAFILAQSYKYFPKGSVHILGVSCDRDLFASHLLMEFDGHYFVGPNNGVFSLMNNENSSAVFHRLNMSPNHAPTFAMKNLYVPVACHIAQGGDPSIIGKPTERIERKIFGELIQRDNEIVGEIIYVDHYGNLITNIKEQIFLDFIGHHLFNINLKQQSKLKIDSLHRSYGEVPDGNLVALIGDHGFIEIAVNGGTKENGGASSLLGLKLKDKIRISKIKSESDSLFG